MIAVWCVQCNNGSCTRPSILPEHDFLRKEGLRVQGGKLRFLPGRIVITLEYQAKDLASVLGAKGLLRRLWAKPQPSTCCKWAWPDIKAPPRASLKSLCAPALLCHTLWPWAVVSPLWASVPPSVNQEGWGPMTMMSDDGQEAIHPQKTKTKYGDYWELANVIQMKYIYM